MKTQIFFILLTIMILHTNSLPHQNDQSLIETTCKNTPNYNLCTAIIRANPGGAAADLPELGLIAVGVVKKKAREALYIISKLSKSGHPKLLPALRRCSEVYKAVLDGDVPVATQVIRGNPKFAETAMADARVEADVCEEALEEVGAKAPPLSNLNKYVSDVAAVARAIIRNLL